MSSSFLPLIGSEIALSLYPQLIKLIPTTIEIQVATRCITYSILAIIGYYITQHSSNTKTKIINITPSKTNTFSFISTSIVMGLVNMIHIISSYMCFNILSSGVGYSIFYIYPIFNLLGRTFIYNEKIDSINYIYILISILGVYLIYKHNKKETTNTNTEQVLEQVLEHVPEPFFNVNDILNTKNTTIGILSGIVSALTESIIYFMVKDNPVSVSPYTQLLKTYLLGGIVSIIYFIQSIITNTTNTTNTTTTTTTNTLLNLDYHYWITLILFNAIIGFVGYLLRFIMIPRLSTLLFNSLIFIGVIFSYIWGYILSNEPITYSNVSGTLLILSSIFLINK